MYAPPIYQARSPAGFILTTASEEFGAVWQVINGRHGAPSSDTWPSVDPVALEFVMPEAATLYQFFWQNGATVAGNFQMGIYRPDWSALIRGTATARSGVNALQADDVTDTVIPAGRYYLAASNSAATTHFFFVAEQNYIVNGMLGFWTSATDAHTLPDPLTNMSEAVAGTYSRVPVLGMAFRSLV